MIKPIMVILAIFALGFVAYLLISTDESTDLDPVDASFTTESDGTEFRIQYVHGDRLDMSRVSILFTIDGERFRVDGPDAGLGDVWDAGETVCGVGTDCIRTTANTASVEVSYEGIIIFQSKERTLRP